MNKIYFGSLQAKYLSPFSKYPGIRANPDRALFLSVEAVVHRNARGFSLLVAASALWVAAAVITFTLMFSLTSRLEVYHFAPEC